MEKIILKGDITITYIEHKHKNWNECFNSSIECWKTVSLKLSFRLSVEMGSQHSKLVYFNLEYN